MCKHSILYGAIMNIFCKVFSMFICVLTCNSLLYADPGRERTVIFDMSGSKNPSFELFNPYAPGSNKSFGWHQTMEEPLFMSHLLTGEIEPWLGI